ncbi:MAG: hypothetical protein MUO33_08580, partial [Sedimentisphaerales bacterium]|nr:hypothetical protein [Sedimentisphaerales bacterium]
MMKWVVRAVLEGICGLWANLDLSGAVPSNTSIRDLQSKPPAYSGRGQPAKQPIRGVDIWRDSLAGDVWTKIDVRDGEKRPLITEIVKRRVV